MNEIPVYLFTGFMDSGKTSLIKDTLFEQGFAKALSSAVKTAMQSLRMRNLKKIM